MYTFIFHIWIGITSTMLNCDSCNTVFYIMERTSRCIDHYKTMVDSKRFLYKVLYVTEFLIWKKPQATASITCPIDYETFSQVPSSCNYFRGQCPPPLGEGNNLSFGELPVGTTFFCCSLSRWNCVLEKFPHSGSNLAVILRMTLERISGRKEGRILQSVIRKRMNIKKRNLKNKKENLSYFSLVFLL